MRRVALPAVAALALAGCGAEPATRPGPSAPGGQAVAASSAAGGREYVGSERCAACHASATAEWKRSSHASTVRAATTDDEDRVSSIIQCSDLTVTHVLGERHHVRFLQERTDAPWGSGRWLALPCAWDVHEKSVALHHVENWRELPWESSCAACHVTGFGPDHSFLELGVGCEECHGPGSQHVVEPSRATILSFRGGHAAQEVTVCASCHLQDGRSIRTGRPFPDAYVAGGSLLDDYSFDWSALDVHDTGRALDVHQKLVIRRVLVDGDESLRCTSCHDLHDLSHDKHQQAPRQAFCSTCHLDDMSLKEYSQSCNVCEF